MKESIVKLYECDFCSKELKRKHAMVSHEIKCDKNPDNAKACHFCKHLTNATVPIWFDGNYGAGGNFQEKNVFKCRLLDKLMYPWQIEKKDLQNKYPETYEDQEPMPKQCDSFKQEDFGF